MAEHESDLLRYCGPPAHFLSCAVGVEIGCMTFSASCQLSICRTLRHGLLRFCGEQLRDIRCLLGTFCQELDQNSGWALIAPVPFHEGSRPKRMPIMTGTNEVL